MADKELSDAISKAWALATEGPVDLIPGTYSVPTSTSTDASFSAYLAGLKTKLVEMPLEATPEPVPMWVPIQDQIEQAVSTTCECMICKRTRDFLWRQAQPEQQGESEVAKAKEPPKAEHPLVRFMRDNKITMETIRVCSVDKVCRLSVLVNGERASTRYLPWIRSKDETVNFGQFVAHWAQAERSPKKTKFFAISEMANKLVSNYGYPIL